MGLYFRYLSRPEKMVDKPHQWLPSLGAQVPGCLGDPKNKLPGGLRRFERWHGRPLRAWKFYWRQSKLRARISE